MADRHRPLDCPHLPGSAVCDSCHRLAAERAAADVRWYRTGQGARVDTAEVGEELRELLRDADGQGGEDKKPARPVGVRGGLQVLNEDQSR